MDPVIHDDRCLRQFLAQGALGLGETYMAGQWDCPALDELVARCLRQGVAGTARTWRLAWPVMQAKLLNLQRRGRAFQVGEAHYDLGNDLFEAMLDKRLVYSCAYWKDAPDLDTAQERKLHLVCRKLRLEPGMRVLDIGCGWGSLARFAAERYGVSVVGVSVSKEQIALAREQCAGLPVEFQLRDYRDISGQYDRVVSIGMFEHVGPKNYGDFMGVAHRALVEDGLFLLHTIGRPKRAGHMDPWITRHIFPNGYIPSMCQIDHAMEGLFVLEDWHNIGPHYDPTLMAWCANFDAHWPTLSERYTETFRRMWRYYLRTCAGAFRARNKQVWQLVMTRHGLPGGYESIR